jgi:catechol 2,3-dioxygenase-like lactoylglutathione lyase family enzyme
MLTHLMLGANDPVASAAFYEAVLGPLGYKRAFEFNGRVGFSEGEGTPPVIVGKPGDGGEATFGNGTMIGFRGKDPETVQAAWNAGLAAGGQDEGAPGPRPMGPPGTYAAYLRDPSGNKIGVFCTIAS